MARNGLLINREYNDFLRDNALDSIDQLFSNDVGQTMDKSGLAAWRQRVCVRLQSNDRQAFLYIKRFIHPPASAWRQVRRARNGAKSIAGIEYAWIQRLQSSGIPCPRIVAFGEEFADGIEVRSVLVTQAVPGQSLEKWMPWWSELPRREQYDLLHTSARLVSMFHGKGYVHRDLYLSHVFYDSEKSGEQALCLIDLQRVLRPRRMMRWIIKDLASLSFSTPSPQVSRSDRLRWLLAYLGFAKLDAASRRLAYRVIGKTATIARKDLRRSRKSKPPRDE